MKKIMTIGVAVIAATVLAQAKLSKIEGSQKFPFIRTLSRLRSIREKYEADEKDAQERLKPDNWDDLVKMEGRPRKEWTPEEMAVHDAGVTAYTSAVEECMAVAREETVEVEVEKVGEESLVSLFDSNPEWTAAQMERMLELLTE